MRVRLRLFLIIYSAIALFLLKDAVSATVPEWQRQRGGTPALNDYFSQDPATKGLLRNVEAHHLNKLPYIKDIPNFSIKNLIVSDIYAAYIEMKYVLDRFPNHPKALEIMGDLSKMMDDDLLGIFYYERAISLYPHYAITHFQYGAFLMDIGKIDEAINEFQKAKDIEPNFAEPYHMLSIAHMKRGEIELAKEFGKKAQLLGYKDPISDNTAVGK